MAMQKTRTIQQDKPATVTYRIFGLRPSEHTDVYDEKATSAGVYKLGSGKKAPKVYSDAPIEVTVDLSQGNAELASLINMEDMLVTAICAEETPYKRLSKKNRLDEPKLRNMERLQPHHLQFLQNGDMVHHNREIHLFDTVGHEGEQLIRKKDTVVFQLAA